MDGWMEYRAESTWHDEMPESKLLCADSCMPVIGCVIKEKTQKSSMLSTNWSIYGTLWRFLGFLNAYLFLFQFFVDFHLHTCGRLRFLLL